MAESLRIRGGAIVDSNEKIAYPSLDMYDALWKFIRDSENDRSILPTQPANIEHMQNQLITAFRTIKEKEDKIFRKAAKQLQYFARDAHAFNNGNKRMAFVYTSLFLAMNGYEIKIPEEERTQTGTIRFILDVAKGGEGEPSLSKISKWLKKYSKKVKASESGFIAEIETLHE